MGRDWQLNEVDLRRVRLLEWISDTGQGIPSVSEFYGHDPQAADTAYDDVAALATRGLVDDASGMGGLDSVAAGLTGEGRALVAEVQQLRSDRAARQAACRAALVSWLYERDACEDASRAVGWQGFLVDPRSWFYGEPFANDDVDRASAWLQRQGLIDGINIAEAGGPIRAFLTDAGVACAVDFDADPVAYIEATSNGARGGITVSGISGGNVQIAGHHAAQTMTVNVDPSQLALMIRGIAELMLLAGLVDDEAEQERVVDGAVEDVETGRNGGRVRDFLSWAKARVEAGTDTAVSAGVGAGLVTVATHAHTLGHFIGL